MVVCHTSIPASRRVFLMFVLC
uniref:Uncharacterized protein n=1 Tax=Anguilla anguilla TaxID=7936 RepID=A0A0E9R0V0_ANGAN